MIAAILAGWRFLRDNWQLALIVLGLAVLGYLKLSWTAAGRALERAAQADRNRRVKEQADAARDDALRSDDPRGELRRDFSRPDPRQ